MPELPEVETMRRGVAVIAGQRITDACRPPCRCRPIQIKPRIDVLRRRVAGRRIASVDRLGKRVVLRLDDDASLVIEPRMTGLVLLADPPGPEHLRFRLQLDCGPYRELLFWDRRGLGTVTLYRAGELAAQLQQGTLGPDALAVDAAQMRARLQSSSRPLKVALLDQSRIAGIGNLYAAEILHVAGVDPRTACNRLSRDAWERVYQATQLVLREAIQHEGSTLGDGTYRNALNNPGSYQSYHRVYARAGQPCGRCGEAEIQRIVQAQRSTFFCPRCQTKRGRHPAVLP